MLIGTAWMAAGTILSRAMTLGVMVVAARLLGQAEFGQLCMVQQSIMFLSVIAGYGLSVTASKHLAELRVSNPVRAGRVLTVILLASGGAAFLSGAAVAIVDQILPPSHLVFRFLAGPALPVALWLAAAGISLTLQGCLAGLAAFRQASWAQIAEAGCGCVLAPLGAMSTGIQGAVFGFAAAALVGCVLSGLFLLRCAAESQIVLQRPTWLEFVREGKELGGYCLPVMLAGQVFAFASWACPALLVQGPNGYQELALLNAASYWFNALILLPNLLQRVGTSLHASALGQRDAATGQAIYRDSVWLNLVIIGAASVPLIVLSPQIMAVFGPEFRRGWPTMAISLATALCLAFVKPAEQTLFATGRTWAVCGLCVVFAATLIGLGWIWSAWGAAGMAAARFAAYINHGVLMSLAVRLTYSERRVPEPDGVVTVPRAA